MINVKVIRGNGDIEASIIQDTLITTESMAVARGTRFLDDPSQGNYYTTIRRTFKTFPKTIIYPNDWITISDSRLNLNGKQLKVSSVDLSISATDGLWMDVSTFEFVEP